MILYVYSITIRKPICPVKNIFGVSCCGCGMTSGFIAIINLDFIEAVKCNMLSIPLFFSLVLYTGVIVCDIICNSNNLQRIDRILLKKPMLAVYVILFVCVTIVNNLK